MQQQNSFKQNQLKHARVSAAYKEKEHVVKDYFARKNLNYAGFNLFLRGFKEEKQLEVWVREHGQAEFVLLTTYPFCASSGALGPKRKEGDGQIPEGIYYINHFNPQSNFHLSLGINYPNTADRILGDKAHPGSAIYIHGNCVTIGCIPITDDKIKELYILSVEAREAGQTNIPVHIFPRRFSSGSFQQVQNVASPSLEEFWANLRNVYLDFEARRQISRVTVDKQGRYVVDDKSR